MKKPSCCLKCSVGFATVQSSEACVCASGSVRALWGVLLHLALFWMDLSQYVVWKSLLRVVVVLVLQVLLIWQTYRKFVLSQYLSSAACLPCGFLFLSLFLFISLFLSVSPTHFFPPPFSFVHSHLYLYCFSFSSLWRFLSSSLLVIILGLNIFLFLSRTHYP